MYAAGWALDRISLGALIIALGLLVDDAIIAVEMMVVKLEEGWDRLRAATYAYTSTAFPMLTGTLVTAAGFMACSATITSHRWTSWPRRGSSWRVIPRSGWSVPGPTASPAPSTICPSSLAMAKALGRAA